MNRIAKTGRATLGVDGYVFDGADGSQMAFWTCRKTTESTARVHDYDEYMMVVQGCWPAFLTSRSGVPPLVSTLARECGVEGRRRHECRRGRQECLRYIAA